VTTPRPRVSSFSLSFVPSTADKVALNLIFPIINRDHREGKFRPEKVQSFRTLLTSVEAMCGGKTRLGFSS
jgi:hypothetical protein